MKHLAFIPARGGSKGVPGKNMRLINGKPLLSYTYDWALNLNIFDTIFISTDCPITLEYGIQKGAKNTYLRTSNNFDNQSASELIMSHQFNKTLNIKDYNYIWYLQPTSPIRNKQMGEKIIDLISNKNDFESIVSFIEVPNEYNSNWQFKLNSEGFMKNENHNLISRRQDLPKSYIRDGRFYIIETSYFLDNKKFIGDKCIPLILDGKRHVNIDNIDDWEKAKKICAEYF